MAICMPPEYLYRESRFVRQRLAFLSSGRRNILNDDLLSLSPWIDRYTLEKTHNSFWRRLKTLAGVAGFI